MKTAYLIFFAYFFWSCNTTQSKLVEFKSDTLELIDEISWNEDSLKLTKIDTSTLLGKRKYLLEKFKLERVISFAEKDSLFDLNYDENKDYVIYYYGSTGTGIKHRIVVYLYDKEFNNYKEDSLLTNLANPTFYLSQKKITHFYIGAGGGGGGKLEWIKDKCVETKMFHVDSHNSIIKWEVFYPLRNKKEIVIQDFQMIPPKNILETDVID